MAPAWYSSHSALQCLCHLALQPLSSVSIIFFTDRILVVSAFGGRTVRYVSFLDDGGLAHDDFRLAVNSFYRANSYDNTVLVTLSVCPSVTSTDLTASASSFFAMC